MVKREINISVADGVIDAAIFTPSSIVKTSSYPPVIMFADIGGVRPATEQKAQCIAEMGYSVLLPNIFYRSRKGSVIPLGRCFDEAEVLPTLVDYGRHLTPEALSRDFIGLIDTVRNELEFKPGGIGTVGYCRGGGIAMRLAALYPEAVVAAAGYHSSRLADINDPHSPMLVVDRIAARVYLGHADNDIYLPPEQIAIFDRALAQSGVHFITELYSGYSHGFTTLDAGAYAEKADLLHLKRLQMLFEETLGSKPDQALENLGAH